MSVLSRPMPALAAVSRLTVTLYTRAQCCCCQSAREILQEYWDVHGFRFEEVDASDPATVARIGPTVPVRFRGEVNRVLFERLLAASGGD